jgi:hypothetical protein
VLLEQLRSNGGWGGDFGLLDLQIWHGSLLRLSHVRPVSDV